MGRRSKPKPRQLSLEEQLRELDDNQPAGPIMVDGKLEPASSARMTYVHRRQEIVDRLRKREAKRLADPGPDEGGRWAPSPYVLQHGHRAEAAPRELAVTPDSSFPKRISTQRMIDRYRVSSAITVRQWKAADRFWRDYVKTGLMPNLTASYSPVFVDSVGDPERAIVGRGDATLDFQKAMAVLGRTALSCIRAVVVEDRPASDWAHGSGASRRSCKDVGMFTLRQALDDLCGHYRY
jgi:hypothetical protein